MWQRFDGTKLRVQATTRTAGAGGTFANEVTLSEGGQDAFNPQAAAGPNVDANGVVAWTALGRHQPPRPVLPPPRRGRVRAAEGRDADCAPRWCRRTTSAPSANRTHGPPLAFPSCNPPVRIVERADGRHARRERGQSNSEASVRFMVITGNAATGGQRGRRRR